MFIDNSVQDILTKKQKKISLYTALEWREGEKMVTEM